MPSFARKLLLFCFTLLVSHTAFSQKRSSFRRFLNRIHISASIGYGDTQYSHQVLHTKAGGTHEAAIVFKEGGKFYLYSGDPEVVYLIRWFDGAYIRMKSYTDWELAGIKKARTKVKFEGRGSKLPISFSGHVDIWEKMRLGLGGAFFINTLEKLAPEEDHASLGPYVPLQKEHYYLRPFVMLGYKFIENSILSVLLDTNFGFDFMYSSADGRFTEFFNDGARNLGLTLEGNISEYLRLFCRLSYEKSDFINFLNEKKIAIVLERESVLFQLGFSLNYPEIPRCPLAGCKIERKHKHGGEVYRGVSIFTSRDAQGRSIYKK